MQTRLRTLLSLLMLALGLAACLPLAADPTALLPATVAATAPAALQPVRLCTSSKSATNVVAWYAIENGLFQKYGLDPQLVSITGGANAASAMLAHEQDFCLGTGGAVANAVAAGQDLVMIAGLYDKFLFALLVTADIHTPQDLIGKSIAVGNAHGSRETAMRLALLKLGLQADTQVKLVPFKDLVDSAMVAAVQAGQVSGALLAIPISSSFQADGLHILENISTMDIFYQSLGVVSTRSYIQAHPDIALAVTKATVEAIARMKHDPEGAKAVIAKYQSLDPTADADTLAQAYAVNVEQFLPDLPYPSKPGLQAVLDEALAANPDVSKVTVDQLIDASLVRQLDEAGFIASLTP